MTPDDDFFAELDAEVQRVGRILRRVAKQCGGEALESCAIENAVRAIAEMSKHALLRRKYAMHKAMERGETTPDIMALEERMRARGIDVDACDDEEAEEEPDTEAVARWEERFQSPEDREERRICTLLESIASRYDAASPESEAIAEGAWAVITLRWAITMKRGYEDIKTLHGGVFPAIARAAWEAQDIDVDGLEALDLGELEF